MVVPFPLYKSNSKKLFPSNDLSISKPELLISDAVFQLRLIFPANADAVKDVSSTGKGPD